MYFLIVILGLLLAMRGAQPALLQRPGEGLKRIGRDAVDLFLTTSLILALWACVTALGKIPRDIQEYAILGPGLAAYLLSRYQKKNEIFFFSVVASVFMISSKQHDPLQGIFLAGGLSAGIALFQVCFLGLRHRLLFSNMPSAVKGWPVLCLLAAFISAILWGLRSLVF